MGKNYEDRAYNNLIAEHGSRWPKIKRHPIMTSAIIVAGVLVASLIVVITLGYWFNWPWVGVNGGYSKITMTPQGINTEYSPGRTLWDWMQLLLVPLILAIGGFWLNQIQRSRGENTTKQRAEDEQKIATDNQHEAALQTYIDKLSELLLKEGLCEPLPNDEVRKIARIRTLIVLRRLDEWRKRNVLEFLYEAGLIDSREPINSVVELSGADFSQTNLRYINLTNADLRGAICWKVDFSEAKLNGADLRGVEFREVVFNGTDLSSANLYRAIFLGPDGKPRKDATDIIIKELEKQAKSLKDAIMPDGSKHL